jgi:nucleotide-binding universal stress UspA family protein
MKNLLLAIDDCEASNMESPIIQRTIELARAFSSKVWILHIVPRSSEPPFNIDEKVLRREVAAERSHENTRLAQLAQSLQNRDVEAEALLVEGAVVDSILKESDRLSIDLIILGCHKHGLLYGALMGFTEEGLLSKCAHPIMFIPVLE